MRYRPGMSARTPRRSFAAPFVVTLATAPACYVSSAPPPQQPPPSQPAAQPAQNAPGVVVANPPRPADPAQQPAPPPNISVVHNPPRPQPADPGTQPPPPVPPNPSVVMNPPRPEPAGTKWHVFKTADGCEAALTIDCPKGAMCNPPPPKKVDCPEGLVMPKGLNIVSQGDGTCVVETEPVHCPPHAMCNPPRPRSVSCPK